jgi:hypothetical protein
MEEREKKIKKQAALEVSRRRLDLKALLEKMKKKQLRKKNSLAVKLQGVKNAMAQDLGKAYKKGKIESCKLIGNGTEEGKNGSLERVEKRKNYCTASFAENYLQYQNCLDTEDFCHVCCDNEFGEFYLNERESCYAASCDAEEIKSEIAPDISGAWIWQSKEPVKS